MWKKTEIICSKIRNKTRVSPLPLFLNIVLEFLARAIKQEVKNKKDPNRKGRRKFFLLADDMIL
jgi:hypothetical protein